MVEKTQMKKIVGSSKRFLACSETSQGQSFKDNDNGHVSDIIIGANGMLGKDLQKVFPDAICLDIDTLDITNKSQVDEMFIKYNPERIINVAAYTNVDGCETNYEIAEQVNGIAVEYLAGNCEKNNCTLVHISTDYVFDGEKETGYDEDDKVSPLSAYGKTKALGEKNLITCSKYYLIRTAWLYGKNGPNFVETITKLAKEKPELKVVNDQTGSPTFTKDLAEAIKQLIGKPFGIYHLTNNGQCTWYEFTKEILKLQSIETPITPCTTEEFPRPAKRPKFSVLNNNKTTPLRHWKDALKEYLEG